MADERLESWKEIAAYLKRDESTVRRWERSEGLPVHRHQHQARSSVYAFPAELDAWREARRPPGAGSTADRPSTVGTIAAALAVVVLTGSGWMAGSAMAGEQEVGLAAGQTPTAVCDTCGEPLGSISADGLVFVSADLSDSLTLRSLTDGTARKLILGDGSGKGSAAFPAISPDGRRIAFAWHIQDTDVTELHVTSVDQAAPPAVLVRNPEFGYVIPVAWLPDGESLLALAARKVDGTWQLSRVAAADGKIQQLRSLDWRVPTPIGHPVSVSPDGRYIAYEALPTNPPKPTSARSPAVERHIYVMAADGSGTENAIAAGAASNNGPVWTPDGRFVVYLSNVSGTVDLWAVPMREGKATGPARLVRKSVGDVLSIGMTASGQYFYFEGRSGVVRSVVASMTLENGRLAASQNVIGNRPAWSPDGRSVAVRREDAIVVRTLASGEERAFRNARMRPLPHLWFADGKALLMRTSDANGGSPADYWTRLDVETGSFARLVPVQGDPAILPHAGVRALAPDGKTLYLGVWANAEQYSQLDRIVALDLTSGRYRDIFRLPFEKAHLPTAVGELQMAMSPDGSHLALQMIDPTTKTARLAVIGTDGSGYRELAADLPGRLINNKLTWSNDGRIYFTAAMGLAESNYEKHRIMRIPAAGGAPEDTGIEIEALEKFDVSGDGARLAYGSLRPEGWGMLLWRLDAGAILGQTR